MQKKQLKILANRITSQTFKETKRLPDAGFSSIILASFESTWSLAFLAEFQRRVGNDLGDVSGASNIQKHGHKHVDGNVAWKN